MKTPHATRHTLNLLLGALTFLTAGFLTILQAQAAGDATWVRTGTGSAWWADDGTHPTNWNPSGTVPGINSTFLTNPDTATFNTTLTQNISISGTRSLKNILFDRNDDYAYTFVGAISIANGGSIQKTGTITATKQDYFSGNVQIFGNATFVNNAINTNSALKFNALTGRATNGQTAVLTLSGSNLALGNQFNSTISDGTNGGNLAIVKEGTGRWRLTSSNNFTGGITVKGGTLDLINVSTTTFVIGGNGTNNQITGLSAGTINLDGKFVFNLSGAATNNAQWNIVDIASIGTVNYSNSFSVVDFTYDNIDKVWIKDVGASTYKFDQSTGYLSVVPEPSTLMLLASVGTFLLIVRRRRST